MKCDIQMPEPNQQASMYGRSAAMAANTTDMQSGGGGQIEDDDDVTAGEESIDNPQMRFEDAAAATAINGVTDYLPGGNDYAPVAENGCSDQLTLSFQGEVYVFNAVSPDKVIEFAGIGSLQLLVFVLDWFQFVWIFLRDNLYGIWLRIFTKR